MAAAGTTIVFNQILELELAEAAYQIALKERHPRDWKRYRSDGRARRRANRLLAAATQGWTELLSVFDHASYRIDEVISRVPNLMTRHGLASYDAVHAATAIEAQVNTIVTTDAGFGSVPASQLRVFTDNSRLRSCRSRRRR